MRLGIVTATRNRFDSYHRLLVSLKNTTTQSDVFVGVEEDDPQLDKYLSLRDQNVFICVVKRSNTVTVTNTLVDRAIVTCDYVIGIPDDMIMKKAEWDEELIKEFQKYTDNIMFLSLMSDMTKNDGYLIATTRKVCQLMGHYMWPNFEHYHADTWIINIAQNVGRYRVLPNYDFTHDHKEDATKQQRIRDGHVHIVADEFRCSNEAMQHNYLVKLLRDHIV